MEQNPNTPNSNQNRNTTDNLSTPYVNLDGSPSNLSFTQLLQEPSSGYHYPTSSIPQQPLFRHPIQPNIFQANAYFQPNPYYFQTTSPHLSQPIPQPISQPMSQPDSVPETQPDPEPEARQRRKHKGKAKKSTRTSATNRCLWKEDEECALCRSWISISVDSIKGNAQTYEAFWAAVLDHFHTQMGKVYRTEDMLSSKWRDLRKHCMNFNGIYMNHYRMWESGKKDFDVHTAAMAEYRATHNMNGFNHVEAWKILRDGPNFALQPEVLTMSSSSNKRSRTSESNDYTHYSDARIDLNDDNEEFLSAQFERPEGRDAAKAKGKGKKAGSSLRKSVSNNQDISYFKDVFAQHLELTKTKLELKKEAKLKAEETAREQLELTRQQMEQQRVQSDMQLLQMSSEGLDGEDRETMEKVKKSIRERLKSVFKF